MPRSADTDQEQISLRLARALGLADNAVSPPDEHLHPDYYIIRAGETADIRRMSAALAVTLETQRVLPHLKDRPAEERIEETSAPLDPEEIVRQANMEMNAFRILDPHEQYVRPVKVEHISGEQVLVFDAAALENPGMIEHLEASRNSIQEAMELFDITEQHRRGNKPTDPEQGGHRSRLVLPLLVLLSF